MPREAGIPLGVESGMACEARCRDLLKEAALLSLLLLSRRAKGDLRVGGPPPCLSLNHGGRKSSGVRTKSSWLRQDIGSFWTPVFSTINADDDSLLTGSDEMIGMEPLSKVSKYL